MASGTTVVTNSNRANMIQMAPGFPTVALQASGATPYPQYGAQYGAQQLAIPTSAPQQVPQKGPLERFLKAEPKVLGAVQILIGLIHIGLGAVSLFSNHSPYIFSPISTFGGYPFWGGIFFISSGSLCVAAANNSNRGLVKSSVGLNITCAIMSLSGIMLYLCELIIYNAFSSYNRPHVTYFLPNMGYGISCVLLLFTLLEFCITVSLAHFGCQATCCSADQPTTVFVPYQIIRSGAVAAEPNPPPPPPAYNNMVTKSQ